jgi:hypothetical protein
LKLVNGGFGADSRGAATAANPPVPKMFGMSSWSVMPSAVPSAVFRRNGLLLEDEEEEKAMVGSFNDD